MTFGFAPSAGQSRPRPPASFGMPTDSSNQLARSLEPAEWAAAGIPLLRDPREVVTGLHARHLPSPQTAVVAVLDQEERLRASASFVRRATASDGWVFRNALLSQLRRVIPHDLRRRTPVRTAVLLYCRDGEDQWTQEDGAWMWGLRDACTLHGLRCGAYITLTRTGWRVLGEGRSGRRPQAERGLPRADGSTAAPGATQHREPLTEVDRPRGRLGGGSVEPFRRATAM
ncbi:hypothetical protein DY218_22575 [Streptomyces triticagri]|uniref:Uncharacterized protein n=1 Tax=Streptomyces triticagri TaxID=2293568 RepID=A0A372M1R9_9ACTN|nr:hypothetical protein [Streptomyces triticagri]RFU84445.1 hypothetical protein DY218_22575 [Streptomyces triticagri]